MARLRQQPAAPVQVAGVPPLPVPQSQPQPQFQSQPQPSGQIQAPVQLQAAAQPQAVAPSPLRQDLLAARNALQGGRIDAGVRTLQEVQLRLVFRPVGPDAPDGGAAGPAASNVARALDAAGVNDIGLAQQYIDRAAADLSGAGSPYSMR